MKTYKVKNEEYEIYEETELYDTLIEALYSEGNYLDDAIDKVSDNVYDIISDEYIKVFEDNKDIYYLHIDYYDENFTELQKLLIKDISKQEIKPSNDYKDIEKE